jgi:hypothetical protein
MNTSTKLLGAALLLMLLAFPLTSLGTDRDLSWLWWTGLVVLAIGAAIPPIVRFAPLGGDGDGDGDEDGERAEHVGPDDPTRDRKEQR